jgi:hypothetical protein
MSSQGKPSWEYPDCKLALLTRSGNYAANHEGLSNVLSSAFVLAFQSRVSLELKKRNFMRAKRQTSWSTALVSKVSVLPTVWLARRMPI